MTTYLKVWGQRRSGTNYLAWLLAENFRDVRVLHSVLGWKHMSKPTITFDGTGWESDDHLSVGPFPQDVEDLDAIKAAYEAGELRGACIVKHPLAWIVSVRKHYGARLTLRLKEMCRLWNESASVYLEHSLGFVRYESLLSEFDETMRRLQTELDLEPAHLDGWKNTDRVLTAAGDGITGDDMLGPQSFSRLWNERELWRQALSARETAEALDELDSDLMERLGYE